MKPVYRSIIIDDERLARLELIRLLKDHPEIVITEEASGVEEAIEKITRHKPDLLFLDIQLRKETGFDLLNRIDYEGEVIFVTAWDQYAMRAFEVNALDYLQKPVSPDRLSMALSRLTSAVTERPVPSSASLKPEDIILLSIGKKIRFQRVDQILMIKAAGPYTEIITLQGERGLMAKTMKEWEERLPSSMFLRVHRSNIINITQITEIIPWSNITYRIQLRGIPEPLVVSRRYAKRMRETYR